MVQFDTLSKANVNEVDNTTKAACNSLSVITSPFGALGRAVLNKYVRSQRSI